MKLKMKPKVLVGCPTSDYKDYCLNKYAESVKNLSYDNYDILLVDNSKTNEYSEKIKKLGLKVIKDKYTESARERIVNSRNILREYAIKNDYGYLLSLEQDVIPPRDIIERLLIHNKKVISGVYFAVNFYQGKHQLLPLIWVDFDEKNKKMFYVDKIRLWSNKLIKIATCGLGCILIHKDILKKFKFRFDSNYKEGFDDMFFCKDLRENKIEIYADTSIKCKHLIKNWSWKNIKL